MVAPESHKARVGAVASQAVLEARKAVEHAGCLLCGTGNRSGLGLDFRVQGDGSVAATFSCPRGYQGYDGALHGGITSALLDAAMTNCLFARGVVAVTVELTVRYLSPVRLGEEAEVVGRLERSEWMIHHLGAEVRQGGTVAARATAKFVDKRWVGSPAIRPA